LGLAKWASVRCVAGAWQTGVVSGWRSVVDGGETCRWRQREETCCCDGGGFAILGRRRDLGFVICCRWLIFVCIYVHIFVCEEHGGSMVVARFTNCSYDEGEDCSSCRSLVLSVGCGGG